MRASARPVVKLVCRAGPLVGQEFPLGGGQVVVGRANDADISIPDTSVSRKHVELRSAPEGWLAVDLGSGNGTVINGEPIAEETLLRDGDLVVIGDTELCFVDPSDPVDGTDRRSAPVRRHSGEIPVRRSGERAPLVRVSRPGRPAADASAGRRGRLIRGGGALLVLALVGLIGLRVAQKSRETTQAQALEAEKAQRSELALRFEEGKALVRSGKWSEAKAKFEEVKAADPSFGEVDSYLERAEKELPNEALMNEAREALAAGKPGLGKSQLAKVSRDSLLLAQQQGLARQLDDAMAAKLSEARALMSRAEYEKVVALTSDLLVGYPDERDAAKLKQDAEAAIAERDAPKPVRAPEPPKPWEGALARYRDGDLSGAVASANECAGRRVARCRALVKDMGEVGELLKRADGLDEKKLARLVALDREISGGRSKLVSGMSTKLANLRYRRASAAKAAADWGKAAEHAKKALESDPDHGPSRILLTEMRSKAKDVYLMAYSLKDMDPDAAVPKLKEVLGMTAPTDEYHQKAKSLLEKLER